MEHSGLTLLFKPYPCTTTQTHLAVLAVTQGYFWCSLGFVYSSGCRFLWR
jgi:hypothetical protein